MNPLKSFMKADPQAISASRFSLRPSRKFLANFAVKGFFALSSLLLLSRARLYVPAELLPHGRQHLLRESMLLPGPEAHVERRSQHLRRYRFIDRSLNRPAAFARILHEAFVFRERRIFR